VTGVDPALRIDQFDYELPPDRIAQVPLAERDAARLMVVRRASGSIEHERVRDLPRLLRKGDVVVVNNTRVYPARLRGRRGTGGAVELLLLQRHGEKWEALARPARKLRPGERVQLLTPDGQASEWAVATIGEAVGDGRLLIRLDPAVEAHLERVGSAPLPPYIGERLSDPERYQTVFARQPGSAAAPTAGLHLTDRLIDELRQADIRVLEVTLHVGLDTFRPVQVERVAEHVIHREWCEVSPEVGAALAAAKGEGGRVIAIGTTSARTLESLGRETGGNLAQGWSGWTDLFITPGYRFTVVDGLLTNFHLPRSTLLLMISAFAGRDLVFRSYDLAIREGYRFYSFGDAQLYL
jgi:S-adenosylmethionine:tRNA ribosyltransferase-isomerase